MHAVWSTITPQHAMQLLLLVDLLGARQRWQEGGADSAKRCSIPSIATSFGSKS